ncbi:MAG: UDP-N-acetylglucosamine 1-carboxyvinyltransferase [Oscillospiraceae bacterium]|nr:UDP-N-acetylglucosamine 1-carboxyvinyltransferase [Oscillospiraceae bacterium]
MEKYLIRGGNPLRGEVTVGGAKNAAVAILSATVLAEGVCTIENVPDIRDVYTTLKILTELGAGVKFINKTTVEIDTTHLSTTMIPYELTCNMRASYYFWGCLLARYGHAKVSMPGGCDFGVRPIDQHKKGFEALGAAVDIEDGMLDVHADKLIGNQVYFDKVSVGATMNVMLAAVRATGVTIMENVAKEPHIVDLANFLNSMGANIMGAGTDIIKIHGVSEMHGTDYAIIPDQIEAGTYMVAAAATGGDVLVKNVIPKHMKPITTKLEDMGVIVEEFDEAIRIAAPNRLSKIDIKTLPYPGFPTDMQPQMAVVACLAEGTSTITEGVWDNRFRYVYELQKMGADIKVDGKMAVIEGIECFKAAPVKATDLRAGAAVVIAGLCSDGETEVEDIYHIERGYEDFELKLCSLGADIKKIEVPDSQATAAI